MLRTPQLCFVRSLDLTWGATSDAPSSSSHRVLCFNLGLPVPSPSSGHVLASVPAAPSGRSSVSEAQLCLWGARGVSEQLLTPGLALRAEPHTATPTEHLQEFLGSLCYTESP